MTKTLYTIPPDVAFIEALAEGLWGHAKGDSLTLSRSLVLLPTRRAGRHLRTAFLRHMDSTAALLPRVQILGDMDEDEFYFEGGFDEALPPAITPLRRQLLLTQLIRQKDAGLPLDQAAQLAEALGSFLDQVQNEECTLDRLPELVQRQELARHWEETVAFLNILTQEWPRVLAAEGCLDPADRRNRLLRRRAAVWQETPPDYPIYAAGSTASLKATAELLRTIAHLPQGCVILPGLDQTLDEEAWQAIAETHPQFGMKEFLEKCDVKRTEVRIWSTSHSETAHLDTTYCDTTHFDTPRVRLLQESMRPADVSDKWRDLSQTTIPSTALENLTRCVLDHPQHEAQVIALHMREVLEDPQHTAVLVTPDRDLAERVRLMLARWGIAANDSAGASLASHPVGAFLVALLEAATPHAGAVDYLALLKHPLTACGMDPATCRAEARTLELAVWRNARPETSDTLQKFQEQLEPLRAAWNGTMSLFDRLRLHIEMAETFAASDSESGVERLWQGEAGEAAAEWLNDWQNAASGFPLLTGEDYMALFVGLLRAVAVRPSYGQHPRLSILGPLEARLIQADLIILGGLNEGTWPPEAVIDPWMSRPMKREFGLSLPERRIGLAAHDFVQLAAAPRVVLTRSKRAGNAPTVPSRFLLQLDTVLHALGYANVIEDRGCVPWAEWAHLMDRPATLEACAPPSPRPAVAARPRELSVTDIGMWRRNPYAIYAKHVLKLKKLEDLDAALDTSDRGIIIHDVLERFAAEHPRELPPQALEELLALGLTAFSAYAAHPEVKAFWWPRFERIARWFVATEAERRTQGIVIAGAEKTGRIKLGTFTLKGRADRIDRGIDASLAVIDYKTGKVPGKKTVVAGYEPQLPLLALIAEQGGFADIAPAPVQSMAYWELKGDAQGGHIHEQDDKPVAELVEQAKQGLQNLIDAFNKAETPYPAVPKPRYQPKYDDYAHLARLAEWGRTESDTEGEE